MKALLVRAVVIAGLAALCYGCGEETPTSPPPACSDVASVDITASNAAGQPVFSAAVGEFLQLDATPRNAEGQAVSQVCHSPAVVWRWTIATCSLLGNTAGFNPQMRGDAVGNCELRAIVGAKTGELTLRITP